MARHLFPGMDAVGRRFAAGQVELEVVGIVPDLRVAGPEHAAVPTYYVPYTQFPFLPGISIVLRTHGNPRAFAPALVNMVLDIDPALPVANIQSMNDNMNRLLARRRFDFVMLGGIAIAAMVLAAVGVFGVMAHSVTQRRHELAIRRAFGARGAVLVSLVFRRALLITGVGLLISSIIAVGFARSLETVLFEVEPLDPITFIAAAGIVGVVALLSAAMPAWRALRIEAAEVLRQ